MNNNATCTSQPTAAPTVNATATVNGANLSWNAVPGAIRYWLFRTEGVHGCNFGKERIATVTGTSFSDTGLKDGRQYFYSVIPVGGAGATPNDSCSGPMSACRTVTPLAPSGGAKPALTVAGVPDGLTVLTGDGDEFIDNCENANLAFSVTNAGGVTLTNVRLVAVRPVSHPSTQVHTPLPATIAASLPAGCGSPAATAQGSFNFTAHGLAHDDTLRFEVDVDGQPDPGDGHRDTGGLRGRKRPHDGRRDLRLRERDAGLDHLLGDLRPHERAPARRQRDRLLHEVLHRPEQTPATGRARPSCG